jgi:serine/threonine protein kinase/tetratricopeptide (TPR) repeat protein
LDESTIDDLVHGRLEREAAKRSLEHVDDCEVCRAVVAEMAALAAGESTALSLSDATIQSEPSVATESAGLAPGDRVGRYVILSLVGHGGMGAVYAARDPDLDRTVAIKILRESPGRRASGSILRDRLQREAQIMARLSHPNVLDVYDIGPYGAGIFMAVRFVEGVTLRTWLRARRRTRPEILGVCLQAGRGLAAAHKAGVIHRDFKPDNILIDRAEHVYVTDFGLARSLESPPRNPNDPLGSSPSWPGDAAIGVSLTESGALVGTPVYMAPEQLAGEEAGERTDIFSFCSTLYEALLGERPFPGGTVQALRESLERGPSLRARAPIPRWLQRVLRRGLARDPALRFESMDAVLAVLEHTPRRRRTAWALAGTLGVSGLALSATFLAMPPSRPAPATALAQASRAIDSIAVLPFIDRGGDPRLAYVSEGITDGLIQRLGQLSNLRVIARASVARYKETPAAPAAVGRALGVRTILFGAVEPRGDTLLVRAELVDARDGRHLWGARRNRPLRDLVLVQEQIANELAQKLRLHLTEEERRALANPPTRNVAAYEKYLRGRYHLEQHNNESFRKAVAAFEDASRLDPNYALAHAGLAESHIEMGSHLVPMPEALRAARPAAERALSLAPRASEAHAAMGLVLSFEGRWRGAADAYRRAAALAPSNAAAWRHLGNVLQSKPGFYDEAHAAMARARSLDPLSSNIAANFAAMPIFARRPADAIAPLEKVLEEHPRLNIALRFLGLAYTLAGRPRDGIAQLKESLSLEDYAQTRAHLAYAYARDGQRAKARQLLGELSRPKVRALVDPRDLAAIHVALGEHDAALRFLPEYLHPADLQADLRMDPLRGDPRFQRLLASDPPSRESARDDAHRAPSTR